MARPPAKIIHTLSFDDGVTWDILETTSQYMLLYKGKPVSIRSSSIIRQTFKYFKSTWPNEGSVKAQVKRLNKKFNCHDFTYIKIC